MGQGERALKWVKRNPLVAALVALVLLSVGGGASGVFVKYLDAKEQEGIARRKAKETADALVDRDAALQQAKADAEAARKAEIRATAASRKALAEAAAARKAERIAEKREWETQHHLANSNVLLAQAAWDSNNPGLARTSGGGPAGTAPVGMALSPASVSGRHSYSVWPYPLRSERGVQPGWDAAGDSELG